MVNQKGAGFVEDVFSRLCHVLLGARPLVLRKLFSRRGAIPGRGRLPIAPAGRMSATPTSSFCVTLC
jgi:hypothetical protein